MSADSSEDLRKWKDKIDLPFTLLSDTEQKVLEPWGVWGEKSMFGKKYMGTTRSHWVIDEDGKVIDAQINVKPKVSVEKALNTITG